MKPLRIPPQMSVYADKHGVFQLVQVKKKKIKINIGCRRVESGRMATSVCVSEHGVQSDCRPAWRPGPPPDQFSAEE